MITASLQHLSSVIRIHPDGGGYGSPWEWACVVHWESPNSVVLLAAQTAPTKEQVEAMRAELLKAGVEHVQWDRRKKPDDKRRVMVQAERRFKRPDHNVSL